MLLIVNYKKTKTVPSKINMLVSSLTCKNSWNPSSSILRYFPAIRILTLRASLKDYSH